MSEDNKVSIYEQVMLDISKDDSAKSSFKDFELYEIREVFLHASVEELRKCFTIAISIQLWELSSHLSKLIKEKT